MAGLENSRWRRAAGRPWRRLVLGAALLAAGPAGAASWARASDGVQHRLAVLPFEINDASGEIGAPDRHDAMLQSLTRAVRERITAAKLYEIVSAEHTAAAVAADNPGTHLRSCNGCEQDIARAAGADRVMIGWIFKVSSLVLSLHVMVKDVATGETVYTQVFDFRGDNEKAWQRAADYMVAALRQRLAHDVHTTN